MVGDLVRQFLSDERNLVVVDRTRMAALYRDRAQASRMPSVYDPATAASFGRVIEASHSAYGFFSQVGSETRLYYRVVEVETTAFIAQDQASWMEESARDSVIQEMVRGLAADIAQARARTERIGHRPLTTPSKIIVESTFLFDIDSSFPDPSPRSRIVPPGPRHLSALSVGGTILHTTISTEPGFVSSVRFPRPEAALVEQGTRAVLGVSLPQRIRGFQALGPDVLIVDGTGNLTRANGYSYEQRWYNEDCYFSGGLVLTDSFAFALAKVWESNDHGPSTEYGTLCAIRLSDGSFAGELVRGSARLSVWARGNQIGVRQDNGRVTLIDGITLARQQLRIRSPTALDMGATFIVDSIAIIADDSSRTLYGYDLNTGGFLWHREIVPGAKILALDNRVVLQSGSGPALILDPGSGQVVGRIQHNLTEVGFLSGVDKRGVACSSSGRYALFDQSGAVFSSGDIETYDRGEITSCDLDEHGRLLVSSRRRRVVLFDPTLGEPVWVYNPDQPIRALSRNRGLLVAHTASSRFVSIGLESHPWFLGWSDSEAAGRGILRVSRAPAPADSIVLIGPPAFDKSKAEFANNTGETAVLDRASGWEARVRPRRGGTSLPPEYVALGAARLVVGIPGEQRADVWVDGFYLGGSPGALSISPGRHAVRIERGGLTILDSVVATQFGRETRVAVSPPDVEQSTLTFRLVPRDASLYINGILLDSGRPSVQRPPGTVLDVKVRRVGFAPRNERVVVPDTLIRIYEYPLAPATGTVAVFVGSSMLFGVAPPVMGWDSANLTETGPVGEPRRRGGTADGLFYSLSFQPRYRRFVLLADWSVRFADILWNGRAEALLRVGGGYTLVPLTRNAYSADLAFTAGALLPDGFHRDDYRGPLGRSFTEVRNSTRLYANVHLLTRLGAARFLNLSAGRLLRGDLAGVPIVQTKRGSGPANAGAEFTVDETRAYRISALGGFRLEAVYAARFRRSHLAPLLQVGVQYTTNEFDYRSPDDHFLKESAWRIHLGLRYIEFYKPHR